MFYFLNNREIIVKILGKLEKTCYVGCSGGVDSMVLLHFLLKGRRQIEVLHVNHGTEACKKAEEFIKTFCLLNKLSLHVGYYKDCNQTEEAWRNFRYNFFSNFTDKPIYLGHTLSDNIETYLLSSIKGTPKFIPYSRNNIARPFLLSSKQELIDYAIRNNINWIEDPTNIQSIYSRNKIRNQIIPVLKDINPGLEKTFKTKCLNKYRQDGIFI